jgi:hypothetical protein
LTIVSTRSVPRGRDGSDPAHDSEITLARVLLASLAIAPLQTLQAALARATQTHHVTDATYAVNDRSERPLIVG